jgi:hypothetical protein
MILSERYKTEFDSNVPLEDFQETPISRWPKEKLNSLLETFKLSLFLSSVSEYKNGVFRGVVIKTDENKTFNLLESVYFKKSYLKKVRLFYMGNQIYSIDIKNAYNDYDKIIKEENILPTELTELIKKRVTENYIKKGYSHELVLALNFVLHMVKNGHQPKSALSISAKYYKVNLKELTSANASRINIVRWTKKKFYENFSPYV